MIGGMRFFITGCLLAAVLCASAHAGESPAPAGGDAVLGAVIDGVDVKIFIPEDAKVVRGAIVHAAHYTMNPQDRWAETCRRLSFAHVALNIDLKTTNRPTKLRKALDEGLRKFAAESGHAELVNLPLAGTGHSAGGMVSATLLKTPERTLTNAVSCGWIADPEKMTPEAQAVPFVFTLGAIPDDFKMLPGIEANFIPARKKGLPWGLAVQWGIAHDFGNSATLFVPWMIAVAEARIPKDWDPRSGPPKLRAMRQEDGWLGDRASVEGNFATVAAWADYRGDKSLATWLPSRAVACVWRAIMSKDPPVVLEAAAADGTALGAWNPKAERGMMVNPGAEIVLSAGVREGAAVSKVEFFDGDLLLGAATQAPWKFVWKNAAQGPHAVFGQWTGPDKKPGVTSPALIVVRKRAK